MKRRTKQLKKMDKEYEIMYYAAWIVLGILIACMIFFNIKGSEILDANYQCNFLKTTGFYCPGCGGTRAFYFFSHFNFVKSVYYNFLVPYGFIVIALYAVNGFLFRRIPRMSFLLNPFFLLCSGGVLVLVRMIMTNVIMLITGIHFI